MHSNSGVPWKLVLAAPFLIMQGMIAALSYLYIRFFLVEVLLFRITP